MYAFVNPVKPSLGCALLLGIVTIVGLAFSPSCTRATQPRPDCDLICRAMAAYEKGDLSEAERLWKEALRKSRNNDAVSALCLGGLMKDEGRFDEAEPLIRQALEADRRIFGVDSAETSFPMRQLAAIDVAKGDLDAAESLLKSALRLCLKSPDRELANVQTALGVSDSETALALMDLAQVYLCAVIEIWPDQFLSNR